MDDQTARVLGALDSVGVSLLLELLQRPRTEVELLVDAGEPAQSTGNRRLHRLKEAGLVSQEPGSPRAPGRTWAVTHPSETESLIDALLALSAAIEDADRVRRKQAVRKLKRARARRLGIRHARGSGPS